MNQAWDRQCGGRPFLFGRNGEILRQIIDNAALGMTVSAMDGTVLYANTAFARDFGFATTAGVAPKIKDLFLDGEAVAHAALEKLFAGTIGEYEGEHKCISAAGGQIWAMVAMSLLRSETTGDPLYLIAQLSSIEHRKSIEEALAASESRWHFALESARQGVWDHDSRTRRMFYSPMWYKMRGIPLDEEVDDSQEAWLARVHPDDRERIRPNVPRQNRGEDGYDILEYRERHRDGHYIWILSRGKPIEWDEDGNVVRTVGTDTDITHLKTIEAELSYAATHDSLTGLANRAAFHEALGKALDQTTACSLLFIDLDRFKPINDTLGHAAGDAALIKAAKAIAGVVRRGDFCARMGGDEFAVLLHGCGIEDARKAASKIIEAISALDFDLDGTRHYLTTSIGIAPLAKDCSPDAVMAMADAACYAAKSRGRGCYAVSGEDDVRPGPVVGASPSRRPDAR